MCGRFTLKTSPDELVRIFGIAAPIGYRARYNIAPSQEVLALCADAGARRGRMLRWGLVPFWADDPAIGNRMINARAETVAEKPAYRASFAKRRCLVLADGYYEWQRRPDGKHPVRFRLRGERPFALAALWDRWERGTQSLQSCTILTTAAAPRFADVHDRMPVILEGEAADAWLEESADPRALLPLLRAWEGEELEAYEVSTLVNNPSHDLPECLDAV